MNDQSCKNKEIVSFSSDILNEKEFCEKLCKASEALFRGLGWVSLRMSTVLFRQLRSHLLMEYSVLLHKLSAVTVQEGGKQEASSRSNELTVREGRNWKIVEVL